MKKMFKNKNNLIIGLFGVVLLMGIGFAVFSQRLSITETSESTSNWNVYISDAEVKENSPNASGSANVTARDTASLVTTLNSPGDKVVYNITVKNDGNVDAVLDDLNLKATNNDSVIIYSHAGIEKGDILESLEEKTFTVTVEYDPNKTGTATTAQKTNSVTLDLDFIQKGNENSGGTGGSGGSESAASMLIAKAVTSGNGLYIDPVEDDRYVYRGADPDNYIWLDLNGDTSKTDNETFRIMSVEADGTIKVVAQNTIGNMAWDPGYSTSISGVTSANSMEGTRYSSVSTDYCYYSTSTTSYYGCNAWGSKTTTLDTNGNNVTVMPREAGSSTTYALPTNEAYLNTYLNTTYLNSINNSLQSKIATHTYNIGVLKNESGQTLETDIAQESAYKWKGKIGLINATDYVRASTNTACTNFYAYYNTSACYNNSTTHNYLFHSVLEWTMSPRSYSDSHGVWFLASGYINYDRADISRRGFWPVFYLTSDISLGGSGTGDDPYTIGN